MYGASLEYSFVVRNRFAAETYSPAIVGANWYRFQGNEHISHNHVASICFLWAVEGHGYIYSNGKTFKVSPGFLIRLPWMHEIRYEADVKMPFHLGTLHLIPNYSDAFKVEPRVAHLDGDPLLRAEFRSSLISDVEPQMTTLGKNYAKNIVQLGTFAISKFSDGEGGEFLYRSLGSLLAQENEIWKGDSNKTDSYPPDLITMMNFIREHLAYTVDMDLVLGAVNCSASTANRLFRNHLGVSMKGWVLQEKMKLAEQLLRESGLRVNEVAKTVGFSDALYFSQTFKKYYGLSPRDYVKKSLRP